MVDLEGVAELGAGWLDRLRVEGACGVKGVSEVAVFFPEDVGERVVEEAGLLGKGVGGRSVRGWDVAVKGAEGVALGVCGGCAVREECREWGVRHEEFGVWGGTTGWDRKNERRRRGMRLRPASPDGVERA